MIYFYDKKYVNACDMMVIFLMSGTEPDGATKKIKSLIVRVVCSMPKFLLY